ncbi:hypothetical protein FOZ60_008964 [Perkinsus olseni]|uniref:Uncharacterized protein n=1 Tax=Perkinsus olseni TaxID=32597 RepID=A0A7J6PFL6_PEROL|nr:hypothetical protein FOZ60_008964 [Perkinsus olseni]
MSVHSSLLLLVALIVVAPAATWEGREVARARNRMQSQAAAQGDNWMPPQERTEARSGMPSQEAALSQEGSQTSRRSQPREAPQSVAWPPDWQAHSWMLPRVGSESRGTMRSQEMSQTSGKKEPREIRQSPDWTLPREGSQSRRRLQPQDAAEARKWMLPKDQTWARSSVHSQKGEKSRSSMQSQGLGQASSSMQSQGLGQASSSMQSQGLGQASSSMQSKEVARTRRWTQQDEQVQALHRKGISVGAGQLGCNIFTGAPLEPMDFYFKFSDKEGITSTHLIDRNRNDTYILEYWDEVKNAGVLPLGRLSEQTDKILKAVASVPSHYQFKQCLHVVDVILKDPPVGYETVAEDWILQVHRNTKEKMQEVLIKLRAAHGDKAE